MNTYAFVVLAALVAKLLLHTVADALNVRALVHDTPGAVRDLYSEEDYQRSVRYVRAATPVEVVERALLSGSSAASGGWTPMCVQRLMVMCCGACSMWGASWLDMLPSACLSTSIGPS